MLSGASRPNIIVIYTDDQGYGDISALNPECKFQTPHLDQLVSEGVAFTHGHSSNSVCTPSRYGLLTGRYSWRTPMKNNVMFSEAKCLIREGRTTLASHLKSQGYNTAMVGKWHLGMDFPGTAKEGRDWSQPTVDMPLDKGFDYFYGIPASLNFGVLAWFEGRYAKVPPTLYTQKKRNERYVDYRIMPPYQESPENRQSFEVAPDFIDNQCLTRFTDKAIDWMGAKAEEAKQGKPFFLYLPYTSPHYPVCPLPEFHGQGEAGPYGEFLIETDYHVGRILDFLAESGLDEDTMIVYTSDNGPEKSWPQRIEKYNHDSRGGLREGKRSVYEGGHRVPFLVRWPAGIQKPGRIWPKLVSQLDLLATFAELVEAPLSADEGEDSQSFAQVLLDSDYDYDRVPHISFGNLSGQEFALTDGPWKLVLPPGKSAELYNLSDDLAEATNVAPQHPERVNALTSTLTELIAQGRSTPGVAQKNDTGHWRQLHWITRQEFNQLAQTKLGTQVGQ